MKWNYKLLIASIIILFIGLMPNTQIETNAATKTYTAYVNVNVPTLNIRKNPSEKAIKIGTLKGSTKLVVLEKNKNGWTAIRYNNKKGYVATKYITPSYKKDTSLVYTYLSEGEKITYKYQSTKNGWDIWDTDKEYNDQVLKETSTELNSGILDSSYETTLKYPLFKGQTWTQLPYADEEVLPYKVLSTNATVTTKAGTFTNVVTVKFTDFNGSTSIMYYAPYVGFILLKIDGTTYSQLISLQKSRNYK